MVHTGPQILLVGFDQADQLALVADAAGRRVGWNLIRCQSCSQALALIQRRGQTPQSIDLLILSRAAAGDWRNAPRPRTRADATMPVLIQCAPGETIEQADRGGLLALKGLVGEAELLQAVNLLLERQNASIGQDPLTGLSNRAALIERLNQCLLRRERNSGYTFAVLMLGLDRFKRINEAMGNRIGDSLLRELSRRLRLALRNLDLLSRPAAMNGFEDLARVGGDEFVVLLDGLRGEPDAMRVAQRIQQALAEPFTVNGKQVVLSVCMGIALGHEQYTVGEDLLRDAAGALREAKISGPGELQLFDPGRHQIVLRRVELENDLRTGLERHELELHYQPVLNLQTGMLNGFEALVRWRHPINGLMNPNDFIPMAEESGLIVPLGQWVLREACRQLCQWDRSFQGLEDLTVRVNVSPRQFVHAQILHQVRDALQTSGLSPHRLKLEITESAIMRDMLQAIEGLNQLRDLDVQIHMDDFGTGYSSLSYLQQLPLDALKIDRSFITRMIHDPRGLAVVQAMISMASAMNLHVVAEGIEQPEQLQHLRAMNCHFGQGYLFSKPVDADRATGLLIENRPWLGLNHRRLSA